MRSKIFFSIVLIICCVTVFSQKISTTKFGDISYEMTQQQVAALTPDKLAVYDVNNPEIPTHDITIDGVKYHISYYKNLKSKQFEVYMISSTSAKISTLSGMRTGSNLDELWKNYKKYDISIQKVVEDEETKSDKAFFVNDTENGSFLAFYLKNNRVVKIALSNESGYLNNNIYYED